MTLQERTLRAIQLWLDVEAAIRQRLHDPMAKLDMRQLLASLGQLQQIAQDEVKLDLAQNLGAYARNVRVRGSCSSPRPGDDAREGWTEILKDHRAVRKDMQAWLPALTIQQSSPPRGVSSGPPPARKR